MMKLNFIDELLDGVEIVWKRLGEVTTIKTGQSVSKQLISTNPGKYPVINSGREPLGFINKWNTDNDPIGITTRGAGVGSITWVESKYFRGNLNYSVTINSNQKINVRYLYHLLLEMQADIKALCTFVGIPALNAGNLKELKIPIPCPENPEKSLEIQEEIVRILDTFTELTAEITAEITAELTARKKQYNYYREQLLSFEEGEVEWKPLGETLVRTKGTKITAGQMKELHKINAPLKIFAGGKTIAFVDFEDIPKKDINREPSIIVKSRGNIEFEYYDKPFSHKNEMWSYHSKNKNINIKFVYYFLKINELYFQNIGSRMQMPQIATPDTDKFKIPVPPIEEQDRIVSILDKFDALTSSITEGLPREIELRQKQYEYYRNMLLSFPKEEVEK